MLGFQNMIQKTEICKDKLEWYKGVHYKVTYAN